MGDVKKPVPLWVVNSLVFLLLFLAVIVYFFWQNHLLKQTILNHAQQHAAIVSEMIQLNAEGTLGSLQSVEALLQNLLENTAGFVAYLNQIEPFDAEELTAFAKEAGLAGISIIGEYGPAVHGPENWRKYVSSIPCSANTVSMHMAEENLYILVSPMPPEGCLVMGIDDAKIATLKNRLDIENSVKSMEKVPGICYIRIDPVEENKPGDFDSAPLMLTYQGKDVAEGRKLVEGMEIRVGVDAGHLTFFIKQLWIHLLLFSSFLIMAGIGLSILLHRYQNSILRNVKTYERELSLQREDAALGRSAAAIAHDIRNPLNTLAIGLQRMEMENACVADEYKTLITWMQHAVRRANSSVTGLLQYARPGIPRIRNFSIADFAADLFGHYRKTCEDLNIRLTTAFGFTGRIESDPVLLRQVLENMLKNAVEAQPDGGFIHGEIQPEGHGLYLMIRNRGCVIPPEEAGRILEPYFTSKTEGAGLGMAIANSIVKSLGGSIDIKIMEGGIVEIAIHLPRSRKSENSHADSNRR